MTPKKCFFTTSICDFCGILPAAVGMQLIYLNSKTSNAHIIYESCQTFMINVALCVTFTCRTVESKERLNFLASGSRYGHANKFKESIPNSRRVNALPGRGTNTNSPVLNNSIKLVLKQTRQARWWRRRAVLRCPQEHVLAIRCRW